MISAATIAVLEGRKLEYILGERASAEVRSTVIDDQTPFVPLVVEHLSIDQTKQSLFGASKVAVDILLQGGPPISRL